MPLIQDNFNVLEIALIITLIAGIAIASFLVATAMLQNKKDSKKNREVLKTKFVP